MSITFAFSRLCLGNVVRTVQKTNQMQLHVTAALCAEPMKKKRRLDPQILRARDDRRRRKLEKAIRRLEKTAKQLKPIDENEVPDSLFTAEQRKQRARPEIKLSEDEIERRALLEKEWTRYKHKEKIGLYTLYENVLKSQRIALDELRLESEELYLAAIEPDGALMPITVKGPTATPPIENYASPDGDYSDVSKKWE